MKLGAASAPTPRLLNQVRDQIRYRHYSLSTQKSLPHWVKFFVRWNGRSAAMRHSRDTWAPEV